MPISDFRSKAAAATQRELGVRDAKQLAASTRSGCVELPMRERHSVASLRRALRLLLALAVLLALSGVAAFVSLAFLPAVPWWAKVLAGVAALVAAVVVLTPATRLEAGLARRIAATRPAPPEFVAPETVSLEPLETYGKAKLVGDDVGTLYHDPAGRRLLIDGAAHRYLVCAPDVVTLESMRHKLGSGVRIDLRVGARTVSFVVSFRKPIPMDELRELPTGFDQGDYHADRLRVTLGLIEPKDAPVPVLAVDEGPDEHHEGAR